MGARNDRSRIDLSKLRHWAQMGVSKEKPRGEKGFVTFDNPYEVVPRSHLEHGEF